MQLEKDIVVKVKYYKGGTAITPRIMSHTFVVG